MSFIRIALEKFGNIPRIGLQKVISGRNISQNFVSFQELQENIDTSELVNENVVNEEPKEFSKANILRPSSDRSIKIPVEISIKYLQSDAYASTYGKDPVWLRYRRNFKGHFPPQKTRRTCIRNQVITTTNPCPICRDEYLVLDYRNILLIKQFISPLNGEIFSFQKTGLCQAQHKKLLQALYNARDYGTITFDPPIMKYDYSEWYDQETKCTHDH